MLVYLRGVMYTPKSTPTSNSNSNSTYQCFSFNPEPKNPESFHKRPIANQEMQIKRGVCLSLHLHPCSCSHLILVVLSGAGNPACHVRGWIKVVLDIISGNW